MNERSRTFKIISICLAAFLLWIFLAPLLAENLIVEKPLPHADAIFVLGGSAAYLERTRQAASLFKEGIAAKVFLTNDGAKGGWNRREQRNPYFAEKARWELIAQGVPENAIEILPKVVSGTQDEAELFAETFRQRNLRSVLLVTSSYHSRRTLRTFERAASKSDLPIEIGIEPAPVGEQSPPTYDWWLKRSGWRWVGGEYLKSIYYWLVY